jgi:hypothetical protein
MKIHLALIAGFVAIATAPAFGQGAAPATAAASSDQMTELATKLNNPTASLISVPLQSNFDFGGGPDDEGFQYKLNVQPVIPFKLSEDWKILTRAIVPFIHQSNRVGTSTQSGLGDTSVTLWFSPEKNAPGAIVWGVGPAFLAPTATDDFLGADKWGLGPSIIVVKQAHGWAGGALVSQTWSVAGNDDRDDLDSTFLQPFLSYQTSSHTTYGFNLESSYDWEGEQWVVPINLQVTQLVRIGKMPVSFQGGWRYYAARPAEGPRWGLRLTATLVFAE